jgi:hypothetical protein
LGEDDLGEAVGVSFEDELVVLGLVDGRDEVGEWRRLLRLAEREVVGLDGEDVREVAPQLERELELERPRRMVLDDDVLLQPFPDEAVAPDRHLVVAEIARKRVPQVEGGRVVLDLVRGEDQRSRAVDEQAPVRQKASVVGEKPHRGVEDVAALVRDAERRPLEDGYGQDG